MSCSRRSSLALAIAAADVLVVKIQTTQLRGRTRNSSPRPSLALKAGDRLEKVGEVERLDQVKTASGVVGWVHSSAVGNAQDSRSSAMNTDMKTQATANEVALAGKGFNKQVEDSYRAKHGDVEFRLRWTGCSRSRSNPGPGRGFPETGPLGDYGGAK